MERGLWRLGDSVSRFLPNFEWGKTVSIWNLLTHTAGFSPWANLFWCGRGRDKVLELLYEDRWPIFSLIYEPGEEVIYSDLGYILLGLAIEQVAGERLDFLAREWIFSEFGMAETMFNPRKRRCSNGGAWAGFCKVQALLPKRKFHSFLGRCCQRERSATPGLLEHPFGSTPSVSSSWCY